MSKILSCPFCDFKHVDFATVEQHAVVSHPDWAQKMISRSALRRTIFLSEKKS